MHKDSIPEMGKYPAHEETALAVSGSFLWEGVSGETLSFPKRKGFP
jgi:hypothetical protein